MRVQRGDRVVVRLVALDVAVGEKVCLDGFFEAPLGVDLRHLRRLSLCVELAVHSKFDHSPSAFAK